MFQLIKTNQILSDMLLNNISDNYIINGSINELNNNNLYYITVNNINLSDDELKKITEIANICIKFLKQNVEFEKNKTIFFKYNNDLCKFTNHKFKINSMFELKIKLR